MEAILMIFPLRCEIMIWPAACENRNVPVRFVSMTLFHCSSVIASTGAPQEVPALLIKMSRRPNCFMAASATAWMLAGSLTSQPSARTCTPSFCNSSAACWQRSYFRETFGHLTAKANRTTGDDGEAAFEIEQVRAPHVASHGARLLLTSNNMQVYI